MNPTIPQSELPPNPTGLFKLVDRKPVPCNSPEEFFNWLTSREKQVAHESVGACEVTTEFTGVPTDGRGELFITTIRGGPLHLTVTRGHTWEQAIANHEAAVALATRAGVAAPLSSESPLSQL